MIYRLLFYAMNPADLPAVVLVLSIPILLFNKYSYPLFIPAAMSIASLQYLLSSFSVVLPGRLGTKDGRLCPKWILLTWFSGSTSCWAIFKSVDS